MHLLLSAYAHNTNNCDPVMLTAAAGADWWEARGETAVPLLPPDTVLDAVLRDLLSPPRATNSSSGSGMHRRSSSRSSIYFSRQGSSSGSRLGSGKLLSTQPSYDADQQQQQQQSGHSSSGAAAAAAGLPRSAPPASLLCRLACHAMVFGNARAVAALWQRFVMQVGNDQQPSIAFVPICRHTCYVTFVYPKATMCMLTLDGHSMSGNPQNPANLSSQNLLSVCQATETASHRAGGKAKWCAHIQNAMFVDRITIWLTT
jgi:hypothetical protein